jgi:hypothetical protein
MADNWDVTYRALAEFGDLMQAAARGRQALREMADEARSEGQAETEAASKAALAHEADTRAINKQRDALLALAAAAKSTQRETAFGGRNTMDEHISDLEKERQRQDLLNRSRWLGFTSPQQAESWQQQVYQQTLLRNRAAQQGYTTPDQYLNFLDQERARTNAQADALRARAAAIQQSARAYTDQANAMRGVHESAGTLGTTGASNIQGYQAALAGLPSRVQTDVSFADGPALADLVTYRAAMASLPKEVHTSIHLDNAAQYLDELAKIRAAQGPAQFTEQGVRDLNRAVGSYQAPPDLQGLMDEARRQTSFPREVPGGGVASTSLPRAVTVRPPPRGPQEVNQGRVPLISIGGVTEALTDVASVKRALDNLSREIASPQIRIDSQGVLSELRIIQSGMKYATRGFGGTGLGPAGYSELEDQFKAVQRQAAAAFSDIEAKGGGSADALARKWSTTIANLQGVFRTIGTNIESALAGADLATSSLVSRISGMFRGLSTSGGGPGKIFTDLAQAAAASGGEIVGALGPAIATFTVIIQLLPALVAGFGALATVFAAMPMTIVSVGAAFAALKIAIDPVMAALSAYVQLLGAQQSAAANPLQSAQEMASMQNQLANAYYNVQQAAYQAMETQLTDAHAVADAQFSLSQAVVQGANQQLVAQHAVRDAQFSLSQAIYQAGIQQTESAMSVAQAQHSLRDSVYSTQQAQIQLNLAWQTAQEDLASLQLQAQFASVNLRGAQLALMEAQQNYATTMANSNATALDRAQAAYQIQAAEEALQQQELQNKNTETQLADVRKYGAKQIFGVTAAQHALLDAQFAQVQASKQSALAQKEAANAQIQSAHAISDAVFALKEAFFEQQQAALQAAHNIKDSQFSLAQALLQQQEGFITSSHNEAQAAFELKMALITMALGLPGIASAQENLNTALSKLPPAARAAVQYLMPLAKWFFDNRQITEAFFRPLLPALSQIGTLLRPVNGFLVSMARELGTLAGQALTYFEKLTNSPAWQILSQGSVTVIKYLGEALGEIVQAFTKLAIVATPFTEWLMKGVDHLAARFLDWATNADKAGSNFSKWLAAVRPALHDVGMVMDAIVKGFATIAGGPMGSPGSLNALRQFETIMHELATVILPNFFGILHALSNPSITSALVDMLGALSHLLLIVVSTPGFQAGFQFFVSSLIAILNVLSRMLAVKPVADILGAIAGAALAAGAALTIAKFTGILGLIGHFRTLASAAQSAWSWIGKVIAVATGGRIRLPGVTGGTPPPAPATSTDAGSTFYNEVVSAGEEFAKLVTGGGSAAADEMGTGGATAASEMEAGGAAAGEGAAAGGIGKAGGLAGFLGDLLPVALPIIAAYFASHEILNLLGPTKTKQFEALNAGTGNTAPAAALAIAAKPGWAESFGRFMISVGNFFSQTLPRLNDQAGAAIAAGWNKLNTLWMNDIQTPVTNFFGQTVPYFFTTAIPNAAASAWDSVWAFFSRSVGAPVGNFFLNTIPSFFADVGKGWGALALQLWQGFDRDVIQPIAHFFDTTIPGFFIDVGKGWLVVAISAWHAFDSNVVSPMSTFFTHTIPSWFDDVWHWFDTKVIAKMGQFFTQSLPGAIEGAFKDSVNWVIKNVINRTINIINDVTGVVGIPKINPVQPLARGGSAGLGPTIAGTGDEDSQFAMLTPGEFVVSKPARMAIDAQYGPQFLYQLNSMRGYAQGGGVPGLGSLLGDLGSIGSFFGHLGSGITSLIGGGIKGIEGLLGKGAEFLFDKVWSVTVQPIESRLLGGGNMVDDVGKLVLDSVKKGVDSVLAGTNAGGGPTPTGLSAPPSSALIREEQAFALSRFPLYGWPASMMPYLVDNWNLESGWNPWAVNPNGGAYGIPQSLGHGHPYNLGDWAAQIVWGENYIKSAYGNPLISDEHEHQFHWYWSGGDVINAAKEATPNQRLRMAMLLGSHLATGWNPGYRAGDRFGAWAIRAGAGPGQAHRIAEAFDPYIAAKNMLSPYSRAVDHFGWKVLPEDAAYAAAMAEGVSSYYTHGGGPVGLAWDAVRKALGLRSQHGTKPPPPGQKPGGLDEAQQWYAYTAQLARAVKTERPILDAIWAWEPPRDKKPKPRKPVRHPGHVEAPDMWLPPRGGGHGSPVGDADDTLVYASQDWAQWYAAKLLLEYASKHSIGDASGSPFSELWRNLSNPLAMTDQQWKSLMSGVGRFERWESGTEAIPPQFWGQEVPGAHWPPVAPPLPHLRRHHKPVEIPGGPMIRPGPHLPRGVVPGHIRPDVGWIERFQRNEWRRDRSQLLDIEKISAAAYEVWQDLYGPTGSLRPRQFHGPATPGPGTPPAGAFAGAPDYTAAILAAAMQGAPVPGMAMGGSVGSVAGMFGHFAGGGGVGDFSAFSGVLSQPGMAVPNRILSEAAAAAGAGAGIGMQFNGGINISNPTPERASDSITHNVNRLAFLHGRQIA